MIETVNGVTHWWFSLGRISGTVSSKPIWGSAWLRKSITIPTEGPRYRSIYTAFRYAYLSLRLKYVSSEELIF